MAATSWSTPRSPAPRSARPRETTRVTVLSRSPPRGAVGRHLAEAKRPPPEQHDSSGMILLDHFRRGDSSSSETPQHSPVIPKDLLLLLLRGAIRPTPPRLCDGVPGERRERELGVVP
jgi:hypothetical protein